MATNGVEVRIMISFKEYLTEIKDAELEEGKIKDKILAAALIGTLAVTGTIGYKRATDTEHTMSRVERRMNGAANIKAKVKQYVSPENKNVEKDKEQK
jgi:hypothetical protein